MFFEQLYLGCLAHASYIFGSNGEAAVVDPRRDVDDYIAVASENGMAIRYVIETHLHADFVSGHRELAERTGATIVISAEARAVFPHRGVRDGDLIALGDLRLRVMATPGHTPESICLVIEQDGRPLKVLTGDTLFIGDVGRPDLAGGAGFSSEQMAALLYDSLHGKILRLPDDVEVWPAHGAGSLCGRNMSKETSSTIGVQRRTNYALQGMPKEAFVSMMTQQMIEAPMYFSRDAQINRAGAAPLRDIPPPHSMAAHDVRRAIEDGAVALDVRSAADFGAAHVPRSINIALNGQYASWAGTLIDPDRDVIIVGGDDDLDEPVTRLARVGLENTRGYLKGGVEAWRDAGLELASVPQISVRDLQDAIRDEPRLQVIDVRRPGEFAAAHVPAAINVPLHELSERAASIDANRPAAVICASGYRSSTAASILERLRFAEISNVVGGTSAWVSAGFETRRD